jgi:hypothetical protein
MPVAMQYGEVAMNDDAQRIIDSCEKNWDAHKSDCSGFVKAVAADLGVTTLAPGDNANAIVDKLNKIVNAPNNATGWTGIQPGDGSAAKEQADAGLFVIGGLDGSDQVNPEPHGHVVVVVSGPLDPGHNKYPTGYWGRLGDVGEKAETINWAWRAVDRDKVSYFATPLPPKPADGSEPPAESDESPDDKPSTEVAEVDGGSQG